MPTFRSSNFSLADMVSFPWHDPAFYKTFIEQLLSLDTHFSPRISFLCYIEMYVFEEIEVHLNIIPFISVVLDVDLALFCMLYNLMFCEIT